MGDGTVTVEPFPNQSDKRRYKRAQMEECTHLLIRRLLTRNKAKIYMEGAWKGFGVGGRMAWIGLPITYILLLLRVSDLYAEGDGRVHTVCC